MSTNTLEHEQGRLHALISWEKLNSYKEEGEDEEEVAKLLNKRKRRRRISLRSSFIGIIHTYIHRSLNFCSGYTVQQQ